MEDQPNVPSKITLPVRLLSIARSQIGFSEEPKGSNWGKNIQKYLASVDIDFPASWCMAFVYWCVDAACKEAGVKNPLVKTAGVLDQWHRVDEKYKFTHPQPNCINIGIMDFGKGHGHTFFIEKFDAVKLQTIEGNSNDDGSREGYEVCRKPGGRNIGACIGFICIPA